MPQALVVFDMDGVLIDVSRSYRETVRHVARLFFQGAKGWETLPDPLFDLEDLARVKQSGGLNNDWDLTCLVIGLLFAKTTRTSCFPSTPTVFDVLKPGIGLDVSTLAVYLRSTDLPLTSLLARQDKIIPDAVAAFFRGDVGTGNIIKQMFQEIYLGKDLFRSTYEIFPAYHNKAGLIQRERLLAEPDVLERIAARHILAIATGRPRAEADYPLDRYGIRKYFSTVLSLDHCLEQERRATQEGGHPISLSKPHPYMLDTIAAHPSLTNIQQCYYVGDMPDDMEAARRSAAGFIAVGMVHSSAEPQRSARLLQQAGAVHILDSFDGLEVLLGSQQTV